MLLKHLDRLSPGDLLYVLTDLLSQPVKAIIAARPKLAPWLPDLEERQRDLLHTSAAPAPSDANQAASDSKEGKPIDRRSEAAVRALSLAYQLGAQLAIAQGHNPTPWDETRAFVFPDGQQFLSASWPEQVSETERAVSLATSLSPNPTTQFSVHGFDHPALLSLITSNNQALSDFIKPKLNTPEASPATIAAQTKHASRLLRDFFRIADRDLPSDDPSRPRIFAAVLQRLNAKSPPPK